MKICPSCREEFFDHVEMCGVCDVALITEEHAESLVAADGLLSKEEVLQDETISFMEAGLMQCRELEKVLARHKISCVVYPVNLEGQTGAALGATGDRKYMVLIRVSDIEKARLALEGQFIEQVAREGQGPFVKDAIDLSENIISCPACGEANPLKDGECPVCGLFLGVVEPEGQKPH